MKDGLLHIPDAPETGLQWDIEGKRLTYRPAN
jgi:hypothetical protein